MPSEGNQSNPVTELMDNADDSDKDDAASARTRTEDLLSQFSPEPLNPSPGVPERELELKIHESGWSGSSYDDYDVITVHGIRDDYKTAWIDKKGEWWLRNKVFSGLSTRQIDYAYEVDEDSTLYEADGLRQHAIKLITQYAMMRKGLKETEGDRPIIWVCHDLGGTIVKEALSIAMSSPKKYGKIAILTTVIIFLGTPHRFHALEDLEDQIHRLVLLPGPIIRSQLLKKVRNLANQVSRINQDFLATKLLDRAFILNVLLVQNTPKNPNDGQSSDYVSPDGKNESNKDRCEMEIPFTTFTQSLSQSFEAAGRIHLDQMNHLDLVRGIERDPWPMFAPKMFNTNGCPIKIKYWYIQRQAKVLSIAPPTRILNTILDPSSPKHPAVSWLLQHATFREFDRPPKRPRIMHIHSNGNPSIDISDVSRHFYVDYDASRVANDLGVRMPANSLVYFEFDRWDSRYNDISSMLLHFINVLVWRFWPDNSLTLGGLDFLEQTKACSLEDLFHLFQQFRDCYPATHKLIFFISCFDQCPEGQRKWFLERVIDQQSYADNEYRMIVSTASRSGLAVESLPDDYCINLEECPGLCRNQVRDELVQEFRIALNSLIERRPVYESFQVQIESQLNECYDFPYLGHIILTWLSHYARGAPEAEIANTLAKLSPMTVENTVNVFISSSKPERRQRAKNVFNWIKHASEPWTPESLAEAIAVHECAGKEVCLDDIDSSEFMSHIEKDFGGMITVQNHDVKFSHPSFYELAEIGIEDTDEPAAFVHAQIATACLHYFWLKNAQSRLFDFLPENFEGGIWETGLDATAIMHQRTSMAEYAVRFWPQHYKASGKYKPNQLVRELFSNKKALAAWKIPFYVLSNPFTRLQKSYISPLPTFVSLGLDDLVEEQLNMERDQLSFQTDCSLAITEAARAGNIKLIQLLLEEVVVEEDELSNALSWSAASGNGDAVDLLLKKIPDLKGFRWPEHLMYRAAAIGLDNVLAAMQQSGRDINGPVDDEWKASPLMVATDHNRLSTVEFLLQLDPKPDVSIGDQDGDDVLWYATVYGHPRIIELLLQNGAAVDKKYSANLRIVQLAVKWRTHKALELLIAANADFSSGEQDSSAKFDQRPPLVVAADLGSTECVRVLLHNGADPNVECASGTALYNAVSGNHIDIVRMLLQNNPKADINVSPLSKEKLLIRAVCTGSTELVSLLIKHGAVLDFVDPNGEFSKTPLSRAASEGDMEMVKLLLREGADVNYTEGQTSDSPLFSAIYRNKVEVAKLLLSKNGDVTWTASDGWNSLHAAHNLPALVPDLLQSNVDINSMSQYGTILHLASRANNHEVVAILLEQNPKPDLEIVYSGSLKSDGGCTALLIACKHRNPICVELLLKAGANQNFQTEDGDDAVNLLLKIEEASEEAEKCLKLLVMGPYKIDVHKVDEHGNTLLHKIETKTPASMVRILAEADVPLTQENKDGYTPLAIAVQNRNEPAAKCLIDHKADVNVLSPRFGSILHLACAHGSVNLVKLLLDNGADREAIDPTYGESLLYTAVDGLYQRKRGRMVRYLIDEAKVPLNQKGGRFAYPIIGAAYLTRSPSSVNTRILKFLIRRKANLNVSDDQGRYAVHLASRASSEDGLKALIDAGADIDVNDNVGRLPIHFAASSTHHDCMTYLLQKFKDKDINVADSDNWTPLLWAARSGDEKIIRDLVERGADLWVRGHAYGVDSDSEWSALKLAKFSDRSGLQQVLTPTERTRDEPGGEKRAWDNSFHKSRPGDPKLAMCLSCLVEIRGSQWKCIECTNDFSLCFKCYGHRYELHDTEHSFQEIGPFFDPDHLHDDDSDLDGDNVAKERAESLNEEETVHGGDDDDDTAADMSTDETLDDIEFDLESPDVITED